MKAIILAAGLGTRLRPYSQITPKPLFSIAGRPLLDTLIAALQSSGCEAVMINTHHLADRIDDFIAGQCYDIPVYTRFEPEILGTGGAIKNVEDFWDDRPFLVINGDIVTDIDFKAVYAFHLKHTNPVTLVLYDYPEINTVSVDKCGFVTGFGDGAASVSGLRRTFTGIQVMDPEILSLIPNGQFAASTDTYEKLISSGSNIKAYVPEKAYWADIGTPRRYIEASFRQMASLAFKIAFADDPAEELHREPLKGDGSDRIWYRLTTGPHTLVLADHGIRIQTDTAEVDSFVAIGRHLHATGISVPKIYLYDTFSGQVFLEDLGNQDLQSFVKQTASQKKIVTVYKKTIDNMIKMSINGIRKFDPSWAYQTPAYSRELIVEKECRYFLESFLNGYLNMDVRYRDFEKEFHSLAGKALRFAHRGLMHRDFQSRNIMLKQNDCYFIDFQGGRIGPIQYDLASLLIDPYVELPGHVQDLLAGYCADAIRAMIPTDTDRFLQCYRYCRITRNLQALGAFGYLTRVKKKGYFKDYIPAAVRTLLASLTALGKSEFPRLLEVSEKINYICR